MGIRTSAAAALLSAAAWLGSAVPAWANAVSPELDPDAAEAIAAVATLIARHHH